MKVLRKSFLVSCLGFIGHCNSQEMTETSTSGAQSLQWARSSELLEDTGITSTSDDRRGNWYEKRQLFFEARGAYEKLREAVRGVNSMTDSIEKMRARIVSAITVFVEKYSFKQGIIDELLAELDQDLQKERKKEVQLNEQERAYLAEITEKKKELEQLKKQIQQFNDVIMGLDTAFATFRDQLQRAEQYEQRGWDNYDKIADVLNDELAEKLYLEIQSSIVNVGLIDGYIRKDFTQYLEQTERIVNEFIAGISQRVDQMQARGVELLTKVTQEIEAEEAAAQKAAAEKKAAQAQKGWLAWISSRWSAAVSWVTSLFGGAASQPISDVPVQERATQPNK